MLQTEGDAGRLEVVGPRRDGAAQGAVEEMRSDLGEVEGPPAPAAADGDVSGLNGACAQRGGRDALHVLVLRPEERSVDAKRLRASGGGSS